MTLQEISKDLLSIEDDLKSIDPTGTRVNEELGAVIAKVNTLRKQCNTLTNLSPLAIHEYDNDLPQLEALEDFMLDPQYCGKIL